jgi:hypothetical protein
VPELAKNFSLLLATSALYRNKQLLKADHDSFKGIYELSRPASGLNILRSAAVALSPRNQYNLAGARKVFKTYYVLNCLSQGWWTIDHAVPTGG